VTARQTRDQGVCPRSAMPTTLPIEEDGHNRRSAGCGRVALLRNRATPDRGVIARLFCKSRQCPDCGPRRADRLLTTYLELLGGWWDTQPDPVLYAVEIAPKAWASLARKLRRAEAAYARIPLTDGDDLVLVAGEGGIGRAIRTREELERTLQEAFAWSSAWVPDRRRPSHSGFEDEPVSDATPPDAGGTAEQGKPKLTVASETPAGWELIGFAGVTLDVALHAADALKLEPAPMPDRKLAAAWAEAYELALPGEGTPTYRALIQRLRLRAATAGARRRRRPGADGQADWGVAA
jgi:hypothetical protein